MSEETNTVISRRYYEEVWDKGNLALVDELVADGIVLNGWAPGLDGLKKVVAGTRASFPNLHYTLEDILLWARNPNRLMGESLSARLR